MQLVLQGKASVGYRAKDRGDTLFRKFDRIYKQKI